MSNPSVDELAAGTVGAALSLSGGEGEGVQRFITIGEGWRL